MYSNLTGYFTFRRLSTGALVFLYEPATVHEFVANKIILDPTLQIPVLQQTRVGMTCYGVRREAVLDDAAGLSPVGPGTRNTGVKEVFRKFGADGTGYNLESSFEARLFDEEFLKTLVKLQNAALVDSDVAPFFAYISELDRRAKSEKTLTDSMSRLAAAHEAYTVGNVLRDEIRTVLASVSAEVPDLQQAVDLYNWSIDADASAYIGLSTAEFVKLLAVINGIILGEAARPVRYVIAEWFAECVVRAEDRTAALKLVASVGEAI